MSEEPTAYAPSTAFAPFNPSAFPNLGTKLDIELENVATSLSETQSRLGEIQRDDGALANDSVGRDQLQNELFAGINTPETWVSGTTYTLRDAVFFTTASYTKWYKCIVAHTAGVFADDLSAGYWELILFLDLAAVSASEAAAAISAAAALVSQNAAAASASTATTQASNASASASAASTSASNAATSETNAAASAAALTGTSTTSLTPSVASKVFATQSGKAFTAGRWVLATSDADPTIYMHGQVTSYVGTTLTVNVTNIGTATLKADWTITISGTRGATGADGAAADANETKALAGVVTADISSGTTAMTANRRYRITGTATATLPSFTVDQWVIVEFGATTGLTQTVGRNSQTIDGVSSNDTCTTYGPIVQYFCTGTGVVRSKIIGYLPS